MFSQQVELRFFEVFKSKLTFYTEKAFFDHKKFEMKAITITLKFFNLGNFHILIWYNYFPQANKNKELLKNAV